MSSSSPNQNPVSPAPAPSLAPAPAPATVPSLGPAPAPSPSPAPAKGPAPAPAPSKVPAPAPATAPSLGPAPAPTKGPAPAPAPVPTRKDDVDSFFSTFRTIFQKSNVVFLLWFLAIYIVVYFIMGLFRSSDSHTNRMVTVSRTFDFIILLLLVISLIMAFYTKTDEEKGQIVEELYIEVTDFVDSSSSVFTLVVFIVVFYFAIYLVGIPMEYDTKPSTVSMIETGSWILLVISMIFLFFKTTLGISVKDYLDELFFGRSEKELPPTSATAPEPPKPKEEVFNIGNHEYTYEDAQTICSAYGSRLATYDEIEKAYNDGGEWCNYGWSEGQMIYFPTQKKTWDALQKTTKHKNSCGRPGINGGFIDNPYARFGVNCYGVKPKPTDADLEKLKSSAASPESIVPKTEEDEVLALKIKYWKENGDKILKINSFNNHKWSAL